MENQNYEKKKISKRQIIVILAIFFAVVSVVIIVATNNSNSSVPNSYTEPTITDPSMYPSYTEPQRENIGSILSSGQAITYAFKNGYGLVRYNDTMYIINANGEICSSFHKTAEWGDILWNMSDRDNWNFYNGNAVFVSKYGTLSIPIDYNGFVNNYWYKSDESEVLGVTEENKLLVRETTETPEGTTVKFGVQDCYGKWITEPKVTSIPPLTSNSDEFRADYRGNNEFLVYVYHNTGSSLSSGFRHFYSLNIDNGAVEDFGGNIPPNKPYYRDDFKYKNQISYVGPLTDGVQVIEIANNSGAHFATAIDENGNQLYEPIRVEDVKQYYSEGLVAFRVIENNIEYILYVDKAGKECAKLQKVDYDERTNLCNDGIISNGYHYYDKTGKLLFE